MREKIPFLKTSGTQIITDTGNPVTLKGYGLGGWLNMENFINGYPYVESYYRNYMYNILGKKKAEYFFEKFLEYYLREEDIKFIKECGMNSLRVPINYRHFESDKKPFVYLDYGFKKLNKLIKWARKYNVYLIIDLHSAQGWQNPDWHCDNPFDKTLLWEHKLFQDRVVELWKEIANRYKDEPVIAGYEILNEPVTDNPEVLNKLYKRIVNAIRKIDKKHIIFLEANIWGQKFEDLWRPFDKNLVYVNHFYVHPFIGDIKYPDKRININYLRREYAKYKSWTDKHNVPMWAGEFGVIFGMDEKKNKYKIKLLDDQLTVVEENRDSWNLWTYKDIGKMGLVYLSPKSKYMLKIKKIRKLKNKLGCDIWLDIGEITKTILKIVRKKLNKDFSTKALSILNENLGKTISIFFSEYLLPYFVKLFKNMSMREIDILLQSWKLENCIIREDLVKVVKRHCKTKT